MWKIKQIFDGDYGCEELAEGQSPKVSVTLVNESGQKKQTSDVLPHRSPGQPVGILSAESDLLYIAESLPAFY